MAKSKLKRVLVRDYLTSYGERPNDVMTYVKCNPLVSPSVSTPADLLSITDLRDKFKDILKDQSPIPRASYIYPTTVTVSIRI